MNSDHTDIEFHMPEGTDARLKAVHKRLDLTPDEVFRIGLTAVEAIIVNRKVKKAEKKLRKAAKS